MKHLKKFNESVSLDVMPLLVRRNVPLIVGQAKMKGVSLEDLISLIKDEWNKSDEKPEMPSFSFLSKEEKDQMMIDALRMSETEWMKKYPVGDHGDYLGMAKEKWGSF